MEMIKVKSSNIKEIGFKDGILRVVFTYGAKYDYLNVPDQIFEDFLQSESIGSFFHKKIKDKYLTKKVK